MELSTLEMDRPKAREAFLEYRHAVREAHRETLTEAQRRLVDADELIMRGYRELARGRQVIELSKTIRAGGLCQRSYRDWNGATRTSFLPRLAVIRADFPQCWLEVSSIGTVLYHPARRSNDRATKRNVVLREVFTRAEVGATSTNAWVADAPHIPPLLRPAHALSNYHLLWEAVWRRQNPPPPRDPALLRHIGGDLYAVLAVWDLTDLERAVLSGRS